MSMYFEHSAYLKLELTIGQGTSPSDVYTTSIQNTSHPKYDIPLLI